jgi:hypothetical protein
VGAPQLHYPFDAPFALLLESRCNPVATFIALAKIQKRLWSISAL